HTRLQGDWSSDVCSSDLQSCATHQDVQRALVLRPNHRLVVSVTLEERDASRVVVVDGDLGCPATLVQLHAVLTRVIFSEETPVIVDLSATTGSSPAITRLLSRTARVLTHRGVPFTIDLSDLVSSTSG